MIILLCVIAYVALIYPGKKTKDRMPTVTKFAHRGYHGDGIPENSMKAFKKAKELGYGIELDVQLTKDNVMVVHHDYDLERTCGVSKYIADLTYGELLEYSLMETDQKIPRFVDVLREIDGAVPLLVELKMEHCNKKLCRLSAKALDCYKGAFYMECFHPYALYWYKMNRPNVLRGQLSDQFYREGKEEHLIPRLIVTHLLTNAVTHPDFVAYRKTYGECLPLRIVRGIFKLPVYGWTFRNEEEIESHGNSFDGFIFEQFML